MRIALIGCRGIPARYGGFETLAEQLAERLAAKGHDVTVYCRGRYAAADAAVAPGVHRIVLPALYTKHLETLSHTFLSVLHQCLRPGGTVLLMNNANAIFIPILRLLGKKVFVHVDGLEWQREKWGRAASAWHRFSEKAAARLAHGLVCDSEVIQRYYERTYRCRPAYIAYGALQEEPPNSRALEKFSLKPGEYFLFVGRLEPENHPAEIAMAYAQIPAAESPFPLVLAGWAPYAEAYGKTLRAIPDSRLRFPGGVYGEDYRALLHHCFAFLHASSVGGTHPVLVEAMGAARPIITSDIPENLETVGDTALSFSLEKRNLPEKIHYLLQNPQKAQSLGQRAASRATKVFNWDKVASDYETLFENRR